MTHFVEKKRVLFIHRFPIEKKRGSTLMKRYHTNEMTKRSKETWQIGSFLSFYATAE